MMEAYCEEIKQHFNEPVLMGFELARVIGYGEDDEDCYLIVQYPRRGVCRSTMVGGYTFLDRLKGQNYVRSTGGEDWDDFTRLDSLLHYNGVPRAEEFLIEIKTTEME